MPSINYFYENSKELILNRNEIEAMINHLNCCAQILRTKLSDYDILSITDEELEDAFDFYANEKMREKIDINYLYRVFKNNDKKTGLFEYNGRKIRYKKIEYSYMYDLFENKINIGTYILDTNEYIEKINNIIEDKPNNN